MSDLLTLILEPDNPCNTTITDSETGKVLYQVVTEHGKKTVTTIKNAAGETIASSEWREVRFDLITLGNRSPVSSGSWLKRSLMPFLKDTVTFEAPEGKSFKWKGNGPGLAFELYTANDKARPIARFQKSRLITNRKTAPPTRELTRARLVLDSRGVEIQDLVVISFLVLEKSRRTNETATLSRAETEGNLGISVTTN